MPIHAVRQLRRHRAVGLGRNLYLARRIWARSHRASCILFLVRDPAETVKRAWRCQLFNNVLIPYGIRIQAVSLISRGQFVTTVRMIFDAISEFRRTILAHPRGVLGTASSARRPSLNVFSVPLLLLPKNQAI